MKRVTFQLPNSYTLLRTLYPQHEKESTMIESLKFREIGRRRWANALAAVGVIASLHWVHARSQSHVPARGSNAKRATGTSLSALVATIEQGDDAKAELAIAALRDAGPAGLNALLAAYGSVAEAANDPRRIRIRSA